MRKDSRVNRYSRIFRQTNTADPHKNQFSDALSAQKKFSMLVAPIGGAPVQKHSIYHLNSLLLIWP